MAGVAEQDRTLDVTELNAIFSSPLFQGSATAKRYDEGDHLADDWRFWSPLMALMSGARVGEIAQSRPSDVRRHGEAWVIGVNARHGKSLKNAATARVLPVHPFLAELGLPQLATARLASGHLLLLPDVPNPILDDAGAPLSTWMSERFLPRLKLKTRRGLGVHSFRHTLQTLLRDAEVPDSVSNENCGHDRRGESVGEGSGKASTIAMAKALERIQLPAAVLAIPPRR